MSLSKINLKNTINFTNKHPWLNQPSILDQKNFKRSKRIEV